MFSLLDIVLTPVYCVCLEQAVTNSPGRHSMELGDISGQQPPVMNAEAFQSSAIPLGWLGCKNLKGQQWRLWNPWRSASKLKVPRTLIDQGLAQEVSLAGPGTREGLGNGKWRRSVRKVVGR